MDSLKIVKCSDVKLIPEIKALADLHREQLGFHAQQTFIDSMKRGELLAAVLKGQVVGFTRYHHRRDQKTTLYEIATAPKFRNKGIGYFLVKALIADCQQIGSRHLRLSCPVELPANQFYQKIGFTRTSSRVGKNRPLYTWILDILPPRKITFVASLTAITSDFVQMIPLWENEGQEQRPFEKCIITPRFIEAGALKYVRYMHDKWGVKVIFDSGGFFVQQGKIRYEELFSWLLDFYAKNDWADGYVLPDYVPTSRQSAAEVIERVHVTAAEGIKFLNRMPSELRDQAIGVLQGHDHYHLKYCFDAFMDKGLQRIGFGSFDTGGRNDEINLMTNASINRLAFVRDLIKQAYLSQTINVLPDLHLFGVSTPKMLADFPNYLATSFDSSGWLRTAGFGNIYLPFQSRRNVTFGGSSLLLSKGFTAAEFYTQCERTGHSCPFCDDFSRLQKNRVVRMWHNALVFSEMTAALNSESKESHA
ncbi:MAG TPA: GNAT family N-acetyltransferase [Thiotrichaceae bacterium]|nr:GNAT family N-acetyltransferase [Thiotrichaceae bacterium]